MFKVSFRIAQLADLPELDVHPPQVGVVCHHDEYINDANGRFILALHEGQIVGHGFIRWTGFRLPDLRAGAPGYPVILGVCVWPATLQGHGIGTLMFCEMERLALENGYDKVALGIYVDNERVRPLYRRLGYVEWDSDPVVDAYANEHPGGVTVFRKTLTV